MSRALRPRRDARSTASLFAAALWLAVATALAADGGGRWLTRVDEAMKQAADGDRYVFVDLYAEWCGWCKVLEEKVFSTPEFQRFTQDWVLLRVDVDDGAEGSALQARYKAYSLPTTLILDARGVRIGMLEGFLPAPSFLGRLSGEIDTYDNLLEAYESARQSEDPKLLRQLASELHDRGDGARAATLYRSMLAFLPPGSKLSAWIYYLLADAHRLSKRFDDAAQALDRARQVEAIDDPTLVERLDLLSYQIAQDSGDCDAAKANLESFLRKHPLSSHRGEVERTLKALRKGDGTVCA